MSVKITNIQIRLLRENVSNYATCKEQRKYFDTELRRSEVLEHNVHYVIFLVFFKFTFFNRTKTSGANLNSGHSL